MSKKERNFPEFNFGGYQQMEPPSENTRPIVFEDEFTKDYIENHYPRIHYHNDTNCFSKKSPRIYPKDVGKLCKNVFTEDDEEKKLVLKKNIKPYSK